MQTSVQMNCSNTDTMDSSMESEARMILQEPCLVEEDSLCEVDHDDTLIIALDEVEEHTITTEPTPNMRSAQSENQPEPNTVSQLDRSHLEDEVKTKKTHSKLKKQEKAAKVGKKYVPSKKAMTDPLKIDMSKPLPLSSSQISLQCLECHIIFSDHKSKERHLKSSHPAEYEQSILRNALFACYVCDRHFTNSTELMTHQKAHVEKKPFKCPICAQTFSKLSELSVHKKVHFGQHGYTCTQCGKPCKTLTLLKYHCRTHTGERPYVCKECGKRFTMPKALQKHLDSHLPKIEGAPLPVYSCSVCKATFKSTKTRHCHMKKKHLSKSALNKTSGQIMKRCTPIITPISISQPSLLQVGPNGPLQKVDANIDTEQLRKLIESLGNVQKVNQVVILGQVPPDAPPLEVPQAISNTERPDDFMGLNSKTNDGIIDPMEQTIILEPITPDGQLINPSFSSLESDLGTNTISEVIFQQDSNPLLQQTEDICHNNILRQNLASSLNKTIVHELTPSLTPTAELEQSGNVLQTEIPQSTFPQSNNMPIALAETSISEQETSMSVQSLLSTVELEMLPLQTEQHIGPVCTYNTQETLCEYQTETVGQAEQDSLLLSNCMDPKDATEVPSKMDEQETKDKVVEPNPMNVTEEVSKLDTGEKIEIPMNVMSAQELVKVRKRKPPKAFFFQGHMQEFISSVYDEFPSKAVKSKKAKKSHLVVKFGPPTKGKQSNKASKPSKQLSKGDAKTKSQSQSKMQKKGKKDKKTTSADLTAEIEVPACSEDIEQVPKQKEGKNKKKKAKAETKKNEKHVGVASPVFKKRQKKTIPSKDIKNKNAKNIKQKPIDKQKDQVTPQSQTESLDKNTLPIKECLLLLKGHKQPQLKVHKLDPLQTSGRTQETQTSPKEKDIPASPSNEISPKSKKKGGRSKKAITLLSSLQASKKQEEPLPPLPKPTRKRKPSSKVEMEGVITSKKSIECKDCGQRFSDVLLLQSHKEEVHIVESPGITFTNGNLFEGVTRIDLYQLPKQVGKDNCSLNTGWDTEPELTELERERCVTFPALNASPSLAEVYYDKSGKDLNHVSRSKTISPSAQLDATTNDNSTDMQVQASTDEDVKEDLLLDVDMVTVGEQNGKDEASPSQEDNLQDKENAPVSADGEGITGEQNDPTLQNVSCSTHRSEIKEEQEETVIERNKNGFRRMSHEKAEVCGEEMEHVKQTDCEILCEKPALDSVSSCNQVSELQITAEKSVQKDGISAVLERDKTVEQESSTETAKEPLQQEHCEREREESPGIVLEKVVTTVITSVDKETSQTQDCENENQDIKMEESGADSTQRDIRTVLVKEEVRQTPQKELVVWNNKANSNSCSPAAIGVTETADSTAQNCSSSQCVFYPVKQEEREVLVGEMQRSSASTKTSHQSEQHTTDNVFAREEVMGPPGLGDLSDGQGQGTEEQSAPSLFDFLLQGSDEEDSTVEWSDPHVHTEEEIMANFYKKQSPSSNQSGISVSGTTTENIRRPIDYFSNYFDWDTWREISHFTNQAQNISTPVSIKEVAQFVGIHVAMGSLKFPNPRFYWEDLTKVPLIADAMPMMRFLELSRKLKLACPQVNDQNCSENRRDAVIGSSNDKQHNSQHLQQNCEPLCKVHHVLKRFARGCHSLRRQGDYGIDQYPLPLTTHGNNKHSLHSTTMINFQGMVLDLSLKIDFSDKESAAEKMVPRGSMVFLCKQELSTPAMLERLLAAGIHSAGQVGGTNGQIGDEFVSSDGKLLLRRSQCGYILSTIGNGQRNIASLIDNFEKAQVSARLNQDLHKLYSIPSTLCSPSCWPQTVLWYLTDLALVNSWLLYKRDVNSPLTLLAFRLEVSKALILASGLDAQDSVSNQTEEPPSLGDSPDPGPLHENSLPDAASRYDGLGHWPEQLAEGQGGRCRFGDCQRTSRVLCLKCCVFLCISRNHNCFINFHSQVHQAKE
ncbi:unnamed protein product [Knipowitschia caucasica]